MTDTSDNPYQAPYTDFMVSGVRDGTVQSLKRIALVQRGLIYSILIMLVSYGGMTVLASMAEAGVLSGAKTIGQR